MKTTPFGYKFELGHYTVVESEASVVRYIFALYENGISLAKISEEVISKYSIQSLNKSKINRIINDERYAGKDLYPKIIDQSTFDRVNAKKSGSSTRPQEIASVLGLSVPLVCNTCGKPLKRFHDSRRTRPEWWKCENCKVLIHIRDGELINEFHNLLNAASCDYSANPNISAVRSMDMLFKEKIIEEALDSECFDKERIKNEILRLAEMKVNSISRLAYIQKTIKETLEKFESFSDYVITLNTIARQIILLDNKTIIVTFKDGTQYLKDKNRKYIRVVKDTAEDTVKENTGT